MNQNSVMLVAIVLLLVLLAVLIWLRHRPRSIKNPEPFMKRWHELQKYCASRKTWPKAIVEADKLLDDALKYHHFKGKTPGERLVAAQHTLSSNESVWFGHKLRDRIVGKDVRTLKKQDILDALNGFRQALKDLGALK